MVYNVDNIGYQISNAISKNKFLNNCHNNNQKKKSIEKLS